MYSPNRYASHRISRSNEHVASCQTICRVSLTSWHRPVTVSRSIWDTFDGILRPMINNSCVGKKSRIPTPLENSKYPRDQYSLFVLNYATKDDARETKVNAWHVARGINYMRASAPNNRCRRAFTRKDSRIRRKERPHDRLSHASRSKRGGGEENVSLI